MRLTFPPVAVNAPFIVVLPVPADCTTVVTPTVLLNNTSLALAIERLPNRVEPTAPAKLMSPPVPALSEKFCAPAEEPVTVPAKTMLLPAVAELPVVSMLVVVPARVTALAKLTWSPLVTILRGPVIVTVPVPVCATAALAAMFAFNDNKPPLTNVTAPVPLVVARIASIVIAVPLLSSRSGPEVVIPVTPFAVPTVSVEVVLRKST